MTQMSNGMHKGQDREWDAVEMGCVAGSLGCRQNGTPQDKDMGRAVMGPWDLGNGGDLMGAWSAWLCVTPALCPQLQERYPDQPMELHLWARQQPLLSCHPDALHGTLFSSAEAFVVLPNATRVPAFLLNIVSDCCHGSGSQGTPKNLAGAGVALLLAGAMLGDMGDTGASWVMLGCRHCPGLSNVSSCCRMPT